MKSIWIIVGFSFFVIFLTCFQEGFCEEEDDAEEEEKKVKELEESYEHEEKKEKKEKKEKELKKIPKNFPFGKCKNMDTKIPKAFTKAQTKCEDEKDKHKGLACKLVCLWEKMDFFTGELKKVDQKEIDEFIDELYVGGLEYGKPIMKKEWHECVKYIGDADDDDEGCKRHKKYFGCVLRSHRKFCSVRPRQQQNGGGGIHLNIGR